ncbi:M-phase inducer phosphatase-like isoform X2 [Linepithema humile]|nr:PREDICTED: M-phase inducer phosphatase-like isoform X2 [Linepithema humile]XP_012227006.1 PREDICTED: M-phase inducer phosphatase-like isoform X2 [Linepithema humile]XP_012227007.1 PREDICTED: M-phase inducer phosphatase-like isoform X2 [Linepithema humile]
MENIVEMEGMSSPGGFSDAGMEASPMSSIISDLSRSTLDSGGPKKRSFQCSKGSCGSCHRTSDQTSEGFADAALKATCALDMTEVDITMPKENFSNIRIFNKELNHNVLRNSLLGEYEHDKENDGATNDLYIPTPKTRCKKVRCPLENCELNIYDNSHGTSPILNKRRAFRVGAAIQRMSTDSQHNSELVMRPLTSPAAFPSGLKSQKINFMRSLSSGYESMDDVNDLMNELIDMESVDDKPQLPTDISKLLSGDIVAPETSMDCDVSTTPSYSRSDFQAKVKWLNNTPSLSKIRTCLFRSPTTTCSPRTITRRYSYDEKSPMGYRLEADISPQTTRAYKRTSDEMPADESILKKSRNNFYLNALARTSPTSANTNALARSKIVLQRSLSETETHANIKWAIHRSATDSDLIGDFSKPCSLPITIGHHPDLKVITSDTLAALLRGEFDDRVHSYRIIDCRYPYEYEGGHIAGALNLYNMDLIERTLLEPLTTAVPKILPDVTKRNVLVFHCEFSWERGPSLSRFLRRLDRERNKEYYPALHYPEIYLLHGGYEKFYSEQKDFCLPQNYKPMRHPDHEDEFKFFRSKSKSWQGDKAKGIGQTVVRTNLKRLGL